LVRFVVQRSELVLGQPAREAARAEHLTLVLGCALCREAGAELVDVAEDAVRGIALSLRERAGLRARRAQVVALLEGGVVRAARREPVVVLVDSGARVVAPGVRVLELRDRGAARGARVQRQALVDEGGVGSRTRVLAHRRGLVTVLLLSERRAGGEE